MVTAMIGSSGRPNAYHAFADICSSPEFPALLRNLFYFNKLFAAFDGIDQDDDRRIDFNEFTQGLNFVGLNLPQDEAEVEFDKLDRNGGGVVLFDEFCAWVAERSCPVNGDVETAFTTSDDRAKPATTGYAARKQPTKRSKKPAKRTKPSPKKAPRAGPVDTQPNISTSEFDRLEVELLATLKDPEAINGMWQSLDFNGNRIVSLAEIDKFVVRIPICFCD